MVPLGELHIEMGPFSGGAGDLANQFAQQSNESFEKNDVLVWLIDILNTQSSYAVKWEARLLPERKIVWV